MGPFDKMKWIPKTIQWVAWVVMFLFHNTSSQARSLDAEPDTLARTQFELTPQFIYFKLNGDVFEAYGAEFGAWYRVTEDWDAGASLRQVYSYAEGGSAVLSVLLMKARWHITGGELPSSTRWKSEGATTVVQKVGVGGGWHLDPSIEQVTFNTTQGSRAFSGVGVLVGYDFALWEDKTLGVGFGASRVTNADTRLVPLRVTLNWQVFL